MNDSSISSLSDSYSLASSISNKVLPFTDITLVGFNMTRNEVLGVNRNGVGFDAGYYFALQERPGQLRFGADAGLNPDYSSWQSLSWHISQLVPGMINLATSLVDPPNPVDPSAQWGKSSADMATIFCQFPVLFLVHAKDMI